MSQPSRGHLLQVGFEQLAPLAAAAELAAELPRMQRIFTRMLGASTARVDPTPAYRSDIVDDHSPYEFSITVGGQPELRMLLEASDGDHSLAARWSAGRLAGEWLRGELGADLAKLDLVADVFEPKSPDAMLALWYAIAFTPGGAPKAKAYLDLRAHGRALAHAVLEEALARLGLGDAYPWLMCDVRRRGHLDELVYFSLDLTAHARARVKVYFRHYDATAAEIARVFGDTGGAQPGDIERFCVAMLGHAGPYTAGPLVSCWSFTPDADADAGAAPATPAVPRAAAGATLCTPVAYYARNDAEATARVHAWIRGTSFGVTSADAAADRYARAVAAVARRPLDAAVGLHSHVSFRREGGVPKLTCYLAPEAYRAFDPVDLTARTPVSVKRPHVPAELVRWYEAVERCTDHPLFRRLEREPVALAPLWTILANNWVAIGDRFPRWLAALVARVDDDRVRSVLAKQLDDELGKGDPDQAHRVLFQRMLADLEPYAPDGDRVRLLEPGRRLQQAFARNYLAKPELEAIGGTLIAEVYGKQVDQAVGALLRRQNELDTRRLTWLVLHEELEIEHVNESVELAQMTPSDPESRAAVCRGVEELAALGSRYFDEIYEVVFG